MSGKLFTGNFSFDTSDQDSETGFGARGAGGSANMDEDRGTGRLGGFGLVEMSDQEEAQTAVSELNGQDPGGRQSKVWEAGPREDRGGSRF